MKINEIIRERRTAKGLTQEQVALYLGVSTPAVNKWEKAVSYPDLTLLSPLARLLGTDLNTLLSFQEDLSRQEITAFLNELCEAAAQQGIEAAVRLAQDKIRAYPSCGMLLLNTALTLEGLVSMDAESSGSQSHLNAIEELYRRAAESEDTAVQHQAKAMLVSKYMERREFDRVEALLGELPDETAFDKKQLQASLYIAQQRWDQAAVLLERKLLSSLGGIQSCLYALMEIALKEGREEDARRVEMIAAEMVDLFGLWECGAYIPQFQRAVYQKDAEHCRAALEKMVPAMQRGWDVEKTPLYCHIPPKQSGENLGKRMLPKLLSDLENPDNPEYGFLRESPGFPSFMAALKQAAHL